MRIKDLDEQMIDRYWKVELMGYYAGTVSSFLTTAAGVLASHAIYLAGLSVWYLVLAKQKWWKAVQLDTICATVAMIILDIAWFAKTISDFVNSNMDGIRLGWLIVMIDLTLCLVAALNVGLAIYCVAKLKRRGDLVVGNVSGPTTGVFLVWVANPVSLVVARPLFGSVSPLVASLHLRFGG